MTTFRTRKFTTPKCRTRSEKPELGVVNRRKLKSSTKRGCTDCYHRWRRWYWGFVSRSLDLLQPFYCTMGSHHSPFERMCVHPIGFRGNFYCERTYVCVLWKNVDRNGHAKRGSLVPNGPTVTFWHNIV